MHGLATRTTVAATTKKYKLDPKALTIQVPSLHRQAGLQRARAKGSIYKDVPTCRISSELLLKPTTSLDLSAFPVRP